MTLLSQAGTPRTLGKVHPKHLERVQVRKISPGDSRRNYVEVSFQLSPVRLLLKRYQVPLKRCHLSTVYQRLIGMICPYEFKCQLI